MKSSCLACLSCVTAFLAGCSAIEDATDDARTFLASLVDDAADEDHDIDVPPAPTEPEPTESASRPIAAKPATEPAPKPAVQAESNAKTESNAKAGGEGGVVPASDRGGVLASGGGPASAIASRESVEGAECLPGTWELSAFDWLATAMRREAQGHPVRERVDPSGTVVLTITAGGASGTVDLAADHRAHHYATRLAGMRVRYDVDLHGELAAPLTIDGDDALTIEHWSARTLRATERAHFGEQTRRRSLHLPVEGPFTYACDGDTLALTPATPGVVSDPIVFTRARS